MKKWISCLAITAIATIGCGTQNDTTPVASEPTETAVSEVSLPALEGEGWLHGDAPTADDLAGKVVVVDVWAHW